LVLGARPSRRRLSASTYSCVREKARRSVRGVQRKLVHECARQPTSIWPLAGTCTTRLPSSLTLSKSETSTEQPYLIKRWRYSNPCPSRSP